MKQVNYKCDGCGQVSDRVPPITLFNWNTQLHYCTDACFSSYVQKFWAST